MNFSQRLKVNPEGTEVKTYAVLCKGTLAHIMFLGWPKWHSVSHCHDQSVQGQLPPLDYLQPSQTPGLTSSRPHIKIEKLTLVFALRLQHY